MYDPNNFEFCVQLFNLSIKYKNEYFNTYCTLQFNGKIY